MTRCIGYAASSPPRMRRSATAVKPGCVASSMLVTPTGRYAQPGTQPKRYGASTGSTVRSLALRYTLQLADDLQDESCPPEINKLGRTIARWTPQITNWHISKVTNRRHRSPQQPNQTDQTSSVRVTQLRELPNTGPPLRRETQLGPTRDRHSPLRRHSP